VASEPGALDLAVLWERVCTEDVSLEAVPLLRWRILSLAERLAPWFSWEGFGDLDLGLRAICTRAWVVEVLDRVRAVPIPLATGAQQPDAPSLLRRRVEAWARDDRERRAGENV
jgi:hypothetical protein